MPAFNQLNNFSPEQQQAFGRMGQNVGPGSYLSKLAGGDQSEFAALEAPALQQFQGLQGDIASRFSGGGGSLSARRGSGFQNSLNQATSDFASRLQAQRLALRQQAIESLHGMTNDFLNQRPFSYVEKQQRRKSNFFGNLLGGAASSLVGGLFSGGGTSFGSR